RPPRPRPPPPPPAPRRFVARAAPERRPLAADHHPLSPSRLPFSFLPIFCDGGGGCVALVQGDVYLSLHGRRTGNRRSGVRADAGGFGRAGPGSRRAARDDRSVAAAVGRAAAESRGAPSGGAAAGGCRAGGA